MSSRKTRKRKKRIESRDVTGLKYFDQLAPLLERWHEVGTQRDKAGNGTVHRTTLIWPRVGTESRLSLRERIATFAERKATLADRDRLRWQPTAVDGPIRHAGPAVPVPSHGRLVARHSAKDPALKEVQQLLTAVDAAVITTLARVAEAAYLRSPSCGERKYAWRLHRPFEVDRQFPSLLDVTGASGKKGQDKRYVLKQHRQAGRCYIMDRGYANFALFHAIHAAGSNYVCRLRDNSNYGPEEERAIDEAARQACVVRDTVAIIGQDRQGEDKPQHKIRVVVIQTAPHEKRGESRGHQPTQRTYEMICFYFLGWATEDELFTHLEQQKRQDS